MVQPISKSQFTNLFKDHQDRRRQKRRDDARMISDYQMDSVTRSRNGSHKGMDKKMRGR